MDARFRFGRNWQNYSRTLDSVRLDEATESIRSVLGVESLEGQKFLDVGCGSGVFSLAAHRLGADVVGFDYDLDSVITTRRLRDTHHADWPVCRGDILDAAFVASLEQSDIVYAWGVLHHTGDLWTACDHAAGLVAPGGQMIVSVYNDQGVMSHVWRWVKFLYVRVAVLRPLLLLIAFLITWGPTVAADLKNLRNPRTTWRSYGSHRGMGAWHDLIDWTGGYPFEVATPGEVREFFVRRGFYVAKESLAGGGRGCNEFLLTRSE